MQGVATSEATSKARVDTEELIRCCGLQIEYNKGVAHSTQAPAQNGGYVQILGMTSHHAHGNLQALTLDTL